MTKFLDDDLYEDDFEYGICEECGDEDCDGNCDLDLGRYVDPEENEEW